MAASAAAAEPSLSVPNIISDGMVLQRDITAPVWGQAKPGSEITVTFAGQTATARADEKGNWLVKLQPLPANASPSPMKIAAGLEKLEVKDVLVGEVWLCSGQSNMAWTVGKMIDGDIEALAPGSPDIRLYNLERKTADSPRFTGEAKWTGTSPSAVSAFSAVGYQFGKVLHAALGVPVGLINSSWGGTPAIAWTRPTALQKHELLAQSAAEWEKNMPDFPAQKAAWEKAMADWKQANGLAPDAKVDPRQNPTAPKAPRFDPESPNRPGSLANGMIAPIAPFAIRGAIWYQGEADAGWEPKRYRERLAVMFGDWREWFQNPDLQIGVVQLASYMPPKTEPSDDPWPNLRESQRQFVLGDKKAGLAVAIDIGEADDIHPRDKFTVGRRLARWALADVYGKLALRGGPELVSASFADGQVSLKFTQIGSGLRPIDGPPLRGFTLAGADGSFKDAIAEIKGTDMVVVHAESVPDPVAVRYAWQNNPAGANLANVERLPASPFEASK